MTVSENDGSKASAKADEWNEAYRSGSFRSKWGQAMPSPELVGYLLATGKARRLRVLDVGCGAGRDAVLMAQFGHDVHGLDVSEEALRLASDYAQGKGVPLALRQGDARHTGFGDASFDLVTDRGCFHHIYGDDRKLYGREMARILKPGGQLLLRGSALSYKDNRFSPLNRAAIDFSFDSELFDVEHVESIWYANDVGGIFGRCALLSRKG